VITSFFAFLLLAPVVYINNLFILPYLRKKPLVFIELFLLNALLFTTISVFIVNTVAKQDFELELFINLFGVLVLALFFASAIKIARDSFIRRQQEKEAELKLLKAQLNPHFLFNTLNNLYGLSVVKSSKLPSLMLKLSDLLRYSLYETKEMYVSLEKEINYLENYISLEKIRLEKTTDIQFIKTGNLSSKKIAPMLFVVFIENAFKHLGVLKNKKNKVIVSIEEKNNTLTFICINTVNDSGLKKEKIEKVEKGIGLQNVKKRLALLYPEKHDLNFSVKNNEYQTHLIVKV
jgi:LytS/YehU family sensor histidine kinase